MLKPRTSGTDKACGAGLTLGLVKEVQAVASSSRGAGIAGGMGAG